MINFDLETISYRIFLIEEKHNDIYTYTLGVQLQNFPIRNLYLKQLIYNAGYMNNYGKSKVYKL